LVMKYDINSYTIEKDMNIGFGIYINLASYFIIKSYQLGHMIHLY
jgi:hypothetical protein